jgi:hypothetical protein
VTPDQSALKGEHHAALAEEARLSAERALAAKMFPKEWAASLSVTGHKGQARRARLRKMAVYELALAPLRATGASCATCKHWKLIPVQREKQRHCEIESDFDGYAITKADHVCVHFDAHAHIKRLEAQHDPS